MIAVERLHGFKTRSTTGGEHVQLKVRHTDTCLFKKHKSTVPYALDLPYCQHKSLSLDMCMWFTRAAAAVGVLSN